MSSVNREEIISEVLDLTEMAIGTLDLDDVDDIETILSMIGILESEYNLQPPKKKRRDWVKPCRLEREMQGSVLVENEISSNNSFLNNIKMSPEIFNYILKKIRKDIQKEDTMLRKSVTPAEKLAATLRFLVTGESYRVISEKTLLSTSFLSNAVPEVCEAIWNNFKDEYLKLPESTEEWESIADQFVETWQFPNCIGVLDGTHFNNFKGAKSMMLLAFVGADYQFISIDVRCTESTCDESNLFQSSILQVIDNANTYLPKKKVIGNGRRLPYVFLSGDAYPLQKQVMTPYPHNTNIQQQKNFNIRLSRARHVVQHALGILFNRFKIFQIKINLSIERVQLINKTCCVLHNILCQQSDDYIKLTPPVATNLMFSSSDKQWYIQDGEAQLIRQAFEDYFNQEGKLQF